MTHEAQKTDLREKVAQGLCRSYRNCPTCGATADDIAPCEGHWRYFLEEADAVLSIARPAIIEECAKVAERQRTYEPAGNCDIALNKAATAIRALAEKP